ncbi:putative carbonic anhydrase 3 [Folsomia candida]|uniref:Putative carbonic anhydrase 3 n=1 Tax=Folsomia candida TaxID=158441 RepID=A0A226EL09_FOLCA|nr:putative carbonic anhydrase 3 [Folsomia candida]
MRLKLSVLTTILCCIVIAKEAETVGIFSGPQEFCYTDMECGPDSDKWDGFCHSGKRQSPINLKVPYHSPSRYTHLLPLDRFQADHFFIQNNGHTINVDMTPVGENSQFFPGHGLSFTKYKFSNVHFHWGASNSEGSEHQLNSRNFSAEMHLTLRDAINSGDPNALAVVAIFLQVDDSVGPSPALAPLVNAIDQIREPHTHWMKVETPIDLSPLIPMRHDATVYSYQGSLTTPPCNSQVNWYVFGEPVPIWSSDVSAFRGVMDGRDAPLENNRRPVQPMSDRRIEIIKFV